MVAVIGNDVYNACLYGAHNMKSSDLLKRIGSAGAAAAALLGVQAANGALQPETVGQVTVSRSSNEVGATVAKLILSPSNGESPIFMQHKSHLSHQSHA